MVQHFAAKAAKSTNNSLNTSFERLSSGSRINFAKDDAAGQGIATRLSAEIKSIKMASRNASDAQAMIDTADGWSASGSAQYVVKNARDCGSGSEWNIGSTADRTALNEEVTALRNRDHIYC